MFRFVIAGIVAILMVLVLYVVTSYHSFKKMVLEEAAILAEVESAEEKSVTEAQLQGLPAPVKKYMEYTLFKGYPFIKLVKLKHKGSFRRGPGKEWLEIEGTEYFDARRPGFVWYGKMKMKHRLWVCARDKYINREGRMTIKLLSTVTLADDFSDELAISALLRYMGEALWFPTMLLQKDYIRWEALDEHSALAVILDGTNITSGVFHFNNEGQAVKFTTSNRYMYFNGSYIQVPFTGYFHDYREVNGIIIPMVVEAEWNLESGDFKYARFEVTEVEYDNFKKE